MLFCVKADLNLTEANRKNYAEVGLKKWIIFGNHRHYILCYEEDRGSSQSEKHGFFVVGALMPMAWAVYTS